MIRRDPVPGRARGPRGQGRELRRAAGCRRPRGAGRALRRRGRRRARVPRHHRESRGARDHRRVGCAHGRRGVHPVYDRRRSARPRTTCTRVLAAGADKVSINSAAVRNPELITRRRGALRQPVHRGGDRRPARGEAGRAGRSTSTAVARRPASRPSPGPRRRPTRGAGEILLTSMDRDGTKDGFDTELLARVSRGGTDSGHRVRRRRHARALLPRRSRPGTRTRCSPPPCFTTGSTRSPRSSRRWQTPGWRCDSE